MRVDPFNPMAQTRLVTVVGPTPFPMGALVEQMVASQCPQRLWLLAYPDTLPSSFDMRPVQSQTGIGLRPTGNENYILITAADYPGLCQGEWWAMLGSGANLIVWEGRVNQLVEE